MPRRTPSLFVGSSREMQTVAKTFIKALSDVSRPTGWWNAREFRTMTDTLAALLEVRNNYDFGLFILGKDDFTISRDKNFLSPRDNVFVELGMFLGAHGPERVLAVAYQPGPNEVDLKVPSDFAGGHIPRFSMANIDAMRTSVDGAAEELKDILKAWLPEERMPLLRSSRHDSKKASFVFGIETDVLKQRQKRISGRALLPVVVKHDPAYPWPENKEIAIGKPRIPPEFVDKQWELVVRAPRFQQRVKKGDQLEFRLFLAPPEITKPDAKTIAELFEQGCVFVGGIRQAAKS